MTLNAFRSCASPSLLLDRSTTKNRPALALLDASAFNTPWPLDCPLNDLATAGLPAPSKVRFKLFTLDHRLVRSKLGELSPADTGAVRAGLAKLLDAAL